MRKRPKVPYWLLAFFVFGGTVFGQDQRRHSAHEHGVGNLNLALEGTDVHLELDSPALNIVGFEQAPSTQADRKALEQAVATLRKGERLFRFSAEAKCHLSSVRVETPLEDQEGREAHRDHDDHEHRKEKHAVGTESHADISAHYRFVCKRPEKLKQVDVRLFQAFPASERLHVQFLTGKGQGAAELTASNHVLRF